jgi:hypothetical protein
MNTIETKNLKQIINKYIDINTGRSSKKLDNKAIIKYNLIKVYQITSTYLFFNFFNSMDYIKFKYYHGISTFINKGI